MKSRSVKKTRFLNLILAFSMIVTSVWIPTPLSVQTAKASSIDTAVSPDTFTPESQNTPFAFPEPHTTAVSQALNDLTNNHWPDSLGLLEVEPLNSPHLPQAPQLHLPTTQAPVPSQLPSTTIFDHLPTQNINIPAIIPPQQPSLLPDIAQDLPAPTDLEGVEAIQAETADFETETTPENNNDDEEAVGKTAVVNNNNQQTANHPSTENTITINNTKRTHQETQNNDSPIPTNSDTKTQTLSAHIKQQIPILLENHQAVNHTNSPPITTLNGGVTLIPHIAAEDSTTVPIAFATNIVAYNYISGPVSLHPMDGGTHLWTDDAVYMLVTRPNGTQDYYYHNYALGGPGINPTLPQDVTYLFQPGTNQIQIEVRDLVIPSRGTSGYQLLAGAGCTDLTPPLITQMNLEQTGRLSALGNQGNAIVVAFVSDDSGDATVSLTFNGVDYPMQSRGDGSYIYVVPYPVNQENSYQINALDACGNINVSTVFNIWGSDSHSLGEYPCVTYCNDGGYQKSSTDPVNTANGNFYDIITDLEVAGVGDTDLTIARAYNSMAVLWVGATEMAFVNDGDGNYSEEVVEQPPQYFGPGWTFPYATYLLQIDGSPFYEGVQIQYADGHTANFTKQGGGYVPDSPATFDTLSKNGDDYVLHHKRTLITERFDSNGRLISRTDRNGNQITLTYSGDQLTRVENGSGRWLTFQYDGDLITHINAPEDKTVQYGYTDGLLTSVTDPRGNTTTYAYDDNDQLTTITTPEGHTSLQQTYDSEYRVDWQQIGRAQINDFDYNGLETTITDSFNNTTRYLYNDLGQIIRITDARNLTKEFGYNSNYNRTFYQDEEGRQWTYTYDSNGNRLTEDGPLTWHREWDYNNLNLVTRQEDALGRETHLEYDAQGNLTRITRPDTTYSEITYDGRGLPTDIYDFELNYTQNMYDPITGDLIRTWDGEAYLTQFAYDNLGRLVETTLPTSNVWAYAYDGNDNLTAINGPLGYQITYTYDDNNNLIQETDPNGGLIAYEYDNSELLTSVENQLDFVTTYTYDDMDNLIQMEDPEGRIWTYDYDVVYNRIAEHGPEDTHTLWQYNGVNNVTHESRCNSPLTGNSCPISLTTRYDYDDLDRIVTMVENDRPALLPSVDTNLTTHFTYDLVGNLLTLTDPENNPTHYQYDELDRLIRVEDAENQVTLFGYDNMDNLIRLKDAENRVWEYRYDGVYNRILEIAPEDTHTLWTYNGVRNLVDEIRCNSPLVNDACADNRVMRYEYDALERPVREFDNFIAGVPASADTNVLTQYQYDLNGNLLVLTDTLNNPTTFVYDDLHRLTETTDAENQVNEYRYDDVGNLLTLTNPRTYSTTYAYDGLNRLISLTDADNETWTYSYDRLSNLIDEQDPLNVITHYDYDPVNRPITITQNYVVGGAATSDQNVATGFAYDGVGNVLTLFDPRGIYQTEYRYDDVYRRILTIDAEGGETRFNYDRVSNLTHITDANVHTTTLTYDDLNRRVHVTNPENHSVTMAYDRLSNLITLVDARSYTTTFTYDGLDRPILVVDALDGEWHYEYDAMGNLLQHIDANGHANDTYTYDRVYRLLSMTDAEGYVTAFAYDANGNVLTLTDGNEHVTTYTYDPLDRLATMTNAELETTSYTYDPLSNQTHLIEADGIVTRYDYDPLYRLVTVNQNDQPGQPESADVNVDTHYGYDEVGNLLTITDAEVHTTTFSYDGLNRLIQEVDADGFTWQYGYDPVGNRTERIDANGNTTTYSYYPDDQLQQINYELDNTTVAYTYDENNNRLKMTDHLSTTTWVYDPLNRVTDVTDPFGRHLGYGYDPVSNRTSLTYHDGRVVNYAYYDNNWLHTVTDPEGNMTSYVRDGVGLPTLTTNPNDTVSEATYDRANRLLTLVNRQTVGEQTTNSAFTYTYNDIGHRTQMIAEYGWRNPPIVTSDYTYDGLRRLIRDEDDEGVWTDYTFDRVGNRLSLTTNDDSLTPRPFDEQQLLYSYSDTNRLLTILGDTHPGQPSSKRQDKVAQALHAFRHEVAAQQGKHIESSAAAILLELTDALITDLENNPPPNANQTGQAIEAIHQQVLADRAAGLIDSDGITNSLLVKLGKAGEANDGVSGDLQTQTFTYDSNGNRINTEYPGPQGPQIQGTDYQYDPENRLIEALDYQSNNNGNRIDRAITTLAYDGGGRRLAKTYDPNEGGGGAKRVEYVFDGLDPVAEYQMWNPQYENFYRGDSNRIITMHHFPSGTHGQMYWYHYDGLGSVSGLTKHQGQSSHNYRYHPYGQIEMPPGNFTDPHNHYAFTGQEWDENTGLHYFGARHYDSNIGVWNTQDIYRGQLLLPQSLHRYQYVLNNPINLVDAYGYSYDGYQCINDGLYMCVEPNYSSVVTSKGFQSNQSSNQSSVDIWQRQNNGQIETVQEVHLNKEGEVKLQTASQSNAGTGEGIYDGNSPRIIGEPINQTVWQDLINYDPNAVCITNGQFFGSSRRGSPQQLSFPVKIDGVVISEGSDPAPEYDGQKLILEIHENEADIRELSKENLYSSSAPNIIGGLTLDAHKDPSSRVGRTFIGIADRDNDGQHEVLLVFNSSGSTQDNAANVLKDFGANKIIMMDGGGSTQLICNGEQLITSSDKTPRSIPQTIVTVDNSSHMCTP